MNFEKIKEFAIEKKVYLIAVGIIFNVIKLRH